MGEKEPTWVTGELVTEDEDSRRLLGTDSLEVHGAGGQGYTRIHYTRPGIRYNLRTYDCVNLLGLG